MAAFSSAGPSNKEAHSCHPHSQSCGLWHLSLWHQGEFHIILRLIFQLGAPTLPCKEGRLHLSLAERDRKPSSKVYLLQEIQSIPGGGVLLLFS